MAPNQNLGVDGNRASTSGVYDVPFGLPYLPCDQPFNCGDTTKLGEDQESVGCYESSQMTTLEDGEKMPLYGALKEESVPKPIYEGWALHCSQTSNLIESAKIFGINVFTRHSHEAPEVSQSKKQHTQRELADMALQAVHSHKAANKRSLPLRLLRGPAKSYESGLDKRLTKLPHPVQAKLNDLLKSRRTSVSNLWYGREWTVVMMREQYHYHFASAKDEEVKKGILRSLSRKGANRGRPIEYFFILRGHSGADEEKRFLSATDRLLEGSTGSQEHEKEEELTKNMMPCPFLAYEPENQQGQVFSRGPSEPQCTTKNATTTNDQLHAIDHFDPSTAYSPLSFLLQPFDPFFSYSSSSAGPILDGPAVQPEATVLAPRTTDQQLPAYLAAPTEPSIPTGVSNGSYYPASAYAYEDTQSSGYAARSAGTVVLSSWLTPGARVGRCSNNGGNNSGSIVDYSAVRQDYRNKTGAFTPCGFSGCDSVPIMAPLFDEPTLPSETPLTSTLASSMTFSDATVDRMSSDPSFGGVEGSKASIFLDTPI
ncbi:hypothetical protein M406DRAFT_67680 [Cryphonectria parasitica EP155]|uniref:Uncharacterized protein n=1 Tax=Cryphonectria parasitica (strain ATCC 38755 / EP155) TaxID=660469 RepID=A0A9P4YEW5_CRYP1|nr:uncharacterized protein M406DRAFT_67680 [Cryphonectria parasitica EP155]KAF3771372.1 hypothetical protein M406DRAFT_67680 [Cryphonectria parasitica EP155]